MPLLLLGYLLAISIFRIIIGNMFPITADEAYYWLWSKHLALSYVDHPSIVAYVLLAEKTYSCLDLAL
jgi:hypothetical protein